MTNDFETAVRDALIAGGVMPPDDRSIPEYLAPRIVAAIEAVGGGIDTVLDHRAIATLKALRGKT